MKTNRKKRIKKSIRHAKRPPQMSGVVEACEESGTADLVQDAVNSHDLVAQREGRHSESEDSNLEIVAHYAWGLEAKIEPASSNRDWMTQHSHGFAYNCLPMVMANQSGWFILAPHGVNAEWNGGSAIHDLRLEILDAPKAIQAMSSVGAGILTWTIPYVFRTPPGWNLLCRGPANYIKDGICPLEGLVETDWSFASFSMNWKFTRPGRCAFHAGEPIAMLVPHKRRDLEAFKPRFCELKDNPQLAEGYAIWIKSRQEFWAAQARGDPMVLRQKFQKHYSRGTTNQGICFSDHQKGRKLAPFAMPAVVGLEPTTPQTKSAEDIRNSRRVAGGIGPKR
jgi:antitoxin (DNA-binding transcriptional repressor) of toxin-antitoxin stability system